MRRAEGSSTTDIVDRPGSRVGCTAPYLWSCRRAIAAAMMIAIHAGGCAGGDDDDSVRGRGLQNASLPASSQAALYEAATRAAFDVTPDLVLLLEPRYLPREGGQVAGDSLPRDLVTALRRRGLVRGTCAPPHDGSRAVPVCDAAAPGYVVRYSEPYRAAGDTIQVHFSALRYRTGETEPAEALSFERAYQLTGSGQRWRVVREARVQQD